MKNKKCEIFARKQREHHRNNNWRLNAAGLYVPHCYHEKTPESLSWWDDVGFVLNGRRVIVWWQHPRYVYSEAIEKQAWADVGPAPSRGDNWLTEGATKNYRRVGASRKKVVSFNCRNPSQEYLDFYGNLRQARERLTQEGIDTTVGLSWKMERLPRAMGIDLIAPLEIRNEQDVAALAALARRLMLRQTTLEAEFPGYAYGRDTWLMERARAAHPTISVADLSLPVR